MRTARLFFGVLAASAILLLCSCKEDEEVNTMSLEEERVEIQWKKLIMESDDHHILTLEKTDEKIGEATVLNYKIEFKGEDVTETFFIYDESNFFKSHGPLVYRVYKFDKGIFYDFWFQGYRDYVDDSWQDRGIASQSIPDLNSFRFLYCSVKDCIFKLSEIIN